MAKAKDNPTNCTATSKSDPVKEMNCIIQIVEEIRLVVMENAWANAVYNKDGIGRKVEVKITPIYMDSSQCPT